ncbi:PREDICTED: NACHT, LRR and PYD domains-containing protein 3-like, partial [Thamnophis sirtalis]|uniref:NACHT, LRR and PYD domains-containing protein 3-like n=1 Tax=Thamnophis sirtalis TaxID=35019 RepID=A0A6I9YN82_9SAUR
MDGPSQSPAAGILLKSSRKTRDWKYYSCPLKTRMTEQPNCCVRGFNMQTVKLAGKTINESSSRHLAEVLSKKQRLTILNLSLRNPDDKPMEMLCRGLKHPDCTIETLELVIDTLTESCSRHLSEVLRTNQRLRTLYLGIHSPEDKEMELLCDG